MIARRLDRRWGVASSRTRTGHWRAPRLHAHRTQIAAISSSRLLSFTRSSPTSRNTVSLPAAARLARTAAPVPRLPGSAPPPHSPPSRGAQPAGHQVGHRLAALVPQIHPFHVHAHALEDHQEAVRVGLTRRVRSPARRLRPARQRRRETPRGGVTRDGKTKRRNDATIRRLVHDRSARSCNPIPDARRGVPYGLASDTARES